MKESVIHLTRTNYGQHHENSALAYYSEKTGKAVDSHQKFTKKHIATSDKYEWYLTGKIDGINEDGILVEIKNRVNKLFYQLKDYEKIQVQIYLNMFKMKEAHLVECIKNNSGCNINIIPVSYDYDLWKTFIKARLELFINFFIYF